MAYGALCGLPPVYGLYTSLVSMLNLLVSMNCQYCDLTLSFLYWPMRYLVLQDM